MERVDPGMAWWEKSQAPGHGRLMGPQTPGAWGESRGGSRGSRAGWCSALLELLPQ